MTMPRKSAIRFRERAELLDFLLEVSRATSETLDRDKLLANVAAVVKDVIPYDLFAILLYSELAQGLRIRYSIGHPGGGAKPGDPVGRRCRGRRSREQRAGDG